MKRRQFYIPDTEAAPAGGASPAPAPAVPAASSPTGNDIPTAPARGTSEASLVVIQPKPIKQSGIIDIKKALGLKEAPSKTLDKESAELRTRNESGQFIPVPKIKTKAAAPAPEAPAGTTTPAAEPAAETTPAAATPEPPATPAAPAPAAKIKIGDREMTPDEITAELAALNAKLTPKPETTPKPEAGAPKPALTPEQQAADEQRLDEEFITQTLANFPGAIDQAAFDKIIADGDVAGFNRLRIQDQLETRKWITRVMNPILEDIIKFKEQANGAVKMHEQVQQYESERQFFDKHQDLKAHQPIVRNVRKVLAEKYPQEWAALSPEERDTETANAVRSLPGVVTAPAVAPVAAAPVAKPTPKPQPKPPTGNLGGGGAPVKVSGMESPSYLMARGKV